jgi:hypothetical protein
MQLLQIERANNAINTLTSHQVPRRPIQNDPPKITAELIAATNSPTQSSD